jgi:hypothetical protein
VCRRSASARMSYADGRSDLGYGDRSWKDGSGEAEMTGGLADSGRICGGWCYEWS